MPVEIGSGATSRRHVTDDTTDVFSHLAVEPSGKFLWFIGDTVG